MPCGCPAMYELVERMDQALEQSRDEFQPISRYRSRRRGWSVDENSVKLTGFTKCRSLEVPAWYPNVARLVLFMHSPQLSRLHSATSIAADVWRRSTNAYEEWALQAFPVRDRKIP